MAGEGGSWNGGHARRLGSEELAPMVLAWGRGRPIRCSRCGQRTVTGSATREGGNVTLRLECRECRGWGTCTVPAR